MRRIHLFKRKNIRLFFDNYIHLIVYKFHEKKKATKAFKITLVAKNLIKSISLMDSIYLKYFLNKSVSNRNRLYRLPSRILFQLWIQTNLYPWNGLQVIALAEIQISC